MAFIQRHMNFVGATIVAGEACRLMEIQVGKIMMRHRNQRAGTDVCEEKKKSGLMLPVGYHGQD